MQSFPQSRRLRDVRYDVRGPIPTEAMRLEAEGHDVLRLNLGNMYPFGLEARTEIVDAVDRDLVSAQAYSDSRGIPAAREAVAGHYRRCGVEQITADDVFLGNGVSELITLVLQAFVDPGDEILVPAPDYPTWTGAGNLTGGVPAHYPADQANARNPSRTDIAAKSTPRTTPLVPTNPSHRRRVQRGDGPRHGRHRPPTRPAPAVRRGIREADLLRRAAPPRGARGRGRRPVPDLRRSVQGVPRVRLPGRLGRGDRAPRPRLRSDRGTHAARQHAGLPQRPRPARDPGGARRGLALGRRRDRPGRADRAPARLRRG